MVYRQRDRNKNDGGIILHIRDDMPSISLNTETSTEGLYVEISVMKKMWLIACSYNPHKTFLSAHLKEIVKNLDIFCSRYKNFIFLGDLNSEPKEQSVRVFCQVYNFNIIIKENTYFQNPVNPSWID